MNEQQEPTMGLLEELRGRFPDPSNLPRELLLLNASEAIEALTASLSDFMENPAFQVSIGGNPHAVDAMMVRACHALALSKGSEG